MSAALDIPKPGKSGRYSPSRADLRRRLADAVESLLAVLDALDGDPEAEDDGTAEPSLGWTRTAAWGSTDDREEDVTPAEPDGFRGF